jgi:hypothetical protein
MQPTNSVGIAKLAFCNWLHCKRKKEHQRPEDALQKARQAERDADKARCAHLSSHQNFQNCYPKGIRTIMGAVANGMEKARSI